MDKSLFKRLKGRVYFDIPMSRYTTMRVGGPAKVLYQPRSINGLIEALGICRLNNISFLAIGNGSNIIVNDKGIDGVVIKLSSPFFKKLEVFGTDIKCGAGVLLNELCRMAEACSLGGAEFLVGIPGSVGGAIIQNAGAHHNSISCILKELKAVDSKGKNVILSKGEIDFGYRSSGLEKLIVTEATFSLRCCDKDDIRLSINRYIEKRLSSQDYTAPSAGCIFKNPQHHNISAGELIDRCGLKGVSIGGAGISKRHANFIINKKGAKANDVLRLIALVKKKVEDRFDIILEEEVRILG